MTNKFLAGAVCLLSLSSSAALAQTATASRDQAPILSPAVPAEQLRAAVAEKVRSSLAQNDVPSASIAYIDDGKVAWTLAVGESEPGKPATSDTLYNIASMTKSIVAETVVRLSHGGAFSMDDSMAEAWVDPDLTDDPRHKLLTPRLALTHRTGLPNWRYLTGDVLKFQNDPGTQFGYSGEGLQYVAHYIENKMGRPLEELVGETVFAPAGMTETTFTDKPWLDGRIAMSQTKEGKHEYAPRRTAWNAADDVWSSSGDYARFMIWIMDNPVSIERAATYWIPRYNLKYQVCQEDRVPPPLCPRSLGFTAGWTVYDTPDNLIVMHGGGDNGEHTLGYFNPITRSGAVIFTNGDNGQKVIRDIVQILLPDPSFNAFIKMQSGG
ncbi:serine hydrolase domain-containing protein [Parasphingorhabdus sp.]|uniref:serine hydrolase domain-containing protein n=1 Tax=Parasphingorhabdus sp. TaxID=2709688 RepID=UPI003A901154